jgi:hypothetical protein
MNVSEAIFSELSGTWKTLIGEVEWALGLGFEAS